MSAPSRPGLPADPTAARKVALVVAFALLSFVGMLGVLLTGIVPRDGSAAKPEFLADLPVAPKTVSSAIAALICLVSIAVARRMHDDHGPLAERVPRALKAHIAASALAEAAALIGFVFVVASGSWEHLLPLVLGAALLALGLVRAVLVFGRLVDEAAR